MNNGNPDNLLYILKKVDSFIECRKYSYVEYLFLKQS